MADSEEHRLLQALRMTHLADENVRNTFYQRVIESSDLEETGFVILLAADSYDVPYKSGHSEEWDEDSTDQFDYFVCAVCPVKDSKAALRYMAEDRLFRGASTGSVLAAPQMGFLFPCFDDRMTNIYSALYYTRGASDVHESFLQGIFHTEHMPMAAEQQKNAFAGALQDALSGECSLEVVRGIQAQIRDRLQQYRESHDPNAPSIGLDEVGEILTKSGVSENGVTGFRESCGKYFEGEGALNPENIIETKKFRVHMPEADVTVDPEQVEAIQTKEIDGRPYLLIPLSEGVTVNGIELSVEGSGEAE